MKIRATLVVSGLLAASLATAGHAAAPKSCKLLTDPKGDSVLVNEPGLPKYEEGALDIVSGDVATNAKTVTGVIRVAGLTTAPSAPTGQNYELDFTVKGTQFYLAAQSAPTGKSFTVGTRTDNLDSTSLGAAAGVFDNAKNEIRIWAPLSVLSSVYKIKTGDKITALHIDASRNLVAVSLFGDLADGTKAYLAGSPSCVAIGK